MWVTNPRRSPYNVEYLCFEPDTPVDGPAALGSARRLPRRRTSRRRSRATRCCSAPFEVGGGFCRAAFVLHDGAVIEFMQYANPDEEGWF